MEILSEKTTKTPEIVHEEDKGLLKITGRFIPEDPSVLFKQLELIVEKSDREDFTYDIDLEYFNSSVGKNLVNLLNLSKSKFDEVNVNWSVDSCDTDTIEFVESVGDMLKLKINLSKYDC